MTAKKKIIDKNGVQVFPITHTRAVVDDNGNSVEERLQEQMDLINQKQLEVGAVPSDVTPTEGSTNWVTSDGVWKEFYDSVDVFTNSSEVTWLAGNINSQGTLVTTYANMYTIVDIETNVEYRLRLNNSTSFKLNTYKYVNNKWNIISELSSLTGEVTTTFTVTDSTRILFIFWDKPTTAQAQAIPLSVDIFSKKYMENLPLDAEPTDASNNLVISGGVYRSTPTIASNLESGVDLDITDETGNVLVRFSNGHIKTKKFDSSAIAVDTSQIYTIAASNSAASDKAKANYVCDGVNDTTIIQNVVNQCTTNAIIRFYSGTYYINPGRVADSSGNYGGIVIPYYARHLVFEGVLNTILFQSVKFKVSQTDYEALGTEAEYSLIRGAKVNDSISNDVSVRNIHIEIYDNLKKVIGIDGDYLGHLTLQRCRATVETQIPSWSGFPSNWHLPNINCVAFRGCGKAQHAYMLWERCSVNCYGIGFAAQGEHLTMDNCGAVYCIYGHAFNYFQSKTPSSGGAWTHGMVVLNDLEELCFNMPYFGDNTTKQTIRIEDFHIEWKSWAYAKGGSYATERVPGSWFGKITYQISFANGSYVNDVNYKFWADGCGQNMISWNEAQSKSATSSVIRTWAPNYNQQVFDTTLNKLIICIDPVNKTWVDALGNSVY